MASVYNVDQNELIEELAKELKSIDAVKPTEWAAFVKTGHMNERPPARADWWYVRAASLLRIVSIKGPIGVSKLRIRYGGKKNRGVAPGRFYKASGNIVRKILQQLEKAELLKQDSRDVHKGRVITANGAKLLSKVADKLLKSKPKEVKVEETPKEEKPVVKEEKPQIQAEEPKGKPKEEKKEAPKETPEKNG